jgi:N-methylhydantoinase A/oxoprolinase/acetone carboxylase beta subunit
MDAPKSRSVPAPSPSAPPVHVIACGVLAVDLRHAARRLGVPIALHALPGGLHAKPAALRARLQETIDAVSAQTGVSRIVIGYGVCGRGTVGLRARGAVLVIPRVHDCIALFLGSDARYREQFARHPGTYYISAGWIEDKPDYGKQMGSDGVPAPEALSELTDRYGRDNAAYIRDFLDSWKRNYTRAAFIDTGVEGDKERYARIAETMARESGWLYERLTGTHDLLDRMLTARESDDAILLVPPGAMTAYDALRRRLHAQRIADSGTSAAAAEPTGAAPLAPDASGPGAPEGLGLGIDAGGTYTDVVLFDYTANTIVSKAKALTTPWNYTIGISNALARLPHGDLSGIRLVAVSTTLATNAIVEDRGQDVGLLVMPPYGRRELKAFRHTPTVFINGQLDIDGTELEAVDLDAVRAVARELAERPVGAFAVGGYASHANPAHELAVKRAVEAETGLSVTCSHDLSEGLNYRVRSETAALNARIIPCLRGLIERLRPALAARAIAAPILIVRSDGSLMSLDAALERPLETMLSGPAASAAGAAWLSGRADALVVDVGGTTTDTAILSGGRVAMCDAGATIGGWQTHIRALDLRTVGLGGDSLVRWAGGRALIGPRRVAPLVWLGKTFRGLEGVWAWFNAHPDAFSDSTEQMTLLAATGAGPEFTPSEPESRLLELLAERPRSLHEAAALLRCMHPSFLPLGRLEARHVILRSGLTPTDLLHDAGRAALWDAEPARTMCAFLARTARRGAGELRNAVLREFERRLAAEMFRKQMADDPSARAVLEQPAVDVLLDHALHGRDGGFRIKLGLSRPIVGIGAPAACFVPGAAALLHTEAVIPPHADVANAVGAVTGSVCVRRHVTITLTDAGLYRLAGVPNAPVFRTIENATAHGAAHLRRAVADLALRAGAADPDVEVVTRDAVAPSADGQAVFVGRTLEGRVTARPRLDFD